MGERLDRVDLLAEQITRLSSRDLMRLRDRLSRGNPYGNPPVFPPGEDEPSGGLGVREPRRPRPDQPSASAGLPEPIQEEQGPDVLFTVAPE